MARHNHLYALAFTVVSNEPDGGDVDPEMLRAALLARIALLDREGGWIEATGAPYDSYAEPDDRR
ncbi:hypothetical protein J2Y58_003897 [Sphingomonas sp. BE138]|uniref:hypothetical protein n=1 Tax=Sphingomonas sp. BE138 TaxID=2817845 RepID=UPI002856C0DE|nr:hypothetical protein [Sphingomonas sp. BE138]MDR6790514.1 hypothetical protein [Sphingomonas sp. BE138]